MSNSDQGAEQGQEYEVSSSVPPCVTRIRWLTDRLSDLSLEIEYVRIHETDDGQDELFEALGYVRGAMKCLDEAVTLIQNRENKMADELGVDTEMGN